MEGSTEGSKECIFIFVFSYPHSTHSTPVQNIAPRNPPASPPILRFSCSKIRTPFFCSIFLSPRTAQAVFSFFPCTQRRNIAK